MPICCSCLLYTSAISRDSDRAAFLGSVIRDSHKFPEFGEAYYEKSFCTARNNFSEFISRLQQQGIVRADLDVTVAVTAFFGSLTSYTILFDTIKGCLLYTSILVGGGVIRSKGAVPEFRKFYNTLHCPVASTIMGGGACPGNDPLFTGMIGMHGNHSSNIASSNCDPVSYTHLGHVQLHRRCGVHQNAVQAQRRERH